MNQLQIKYRIETSKAVILEEVEEILDLARQYKQQIDELKEVSEITKGLLEEKLDSNSIASAKDDDISVTWTPPSKQKRISRDKVIEVLTAHGIPVDAIEDCYEEYDRKEVITVKKR